MILNHKELINLPVYTESDQHLGKISDFEIEASSNYIVKYYIKPESLIKELVSKELIVSSEQVISVDKEKMIVEDNIVKSAEMIKKERLTKNNVAAAPASSTIEITNDLK